MQQFFDDDRYLVSIHGSIFTNIGGMMAYIKRRSDDVASTGGSRESNGKWYHIVAIYSYLEKEYIRDYEKIPDDIHQYVLNAFSQEVQP